MLLKQSPLAPAAHGGVANVGVGGGRLGPVSSSAAAPLDFSATSNGVNHNNDDEEEEEEIDDDEENGQ